MVEIASEWLKMTHSLKFHDLMGLVFVKIQSPTTKSHLSSYILHCQKAELFVIKKELFGEPLIKKKFFSIFKWDGGVGLRRLVIFSPIKCLCGIKTLGNF